MEKTIERPQAGTTATTTTTLDNKIPQLHQPTEPISPNSATCVCKSATPDRLKVPKPFKYPERYTSPTDLIMSPISRGLLARSRKPNALLPPTRNQSKLQNFQHQEVGLFQL